jgi:GT2 family glycosyltransferase
LRSDKENPVTVVIPVYNAPDELERCLASVHRTTDRTAQVLVIDDASPDPAVRPLLEHWRGRAGRNWTFLFNPGNRGFVATANRGMQRAAGDVVLLNSDTVVTPGWLEGLQRCLASDSRIATATPWTNNGEIASIPLFCQPNPAPPNPDAVAAVIAAEGRATYPELPTAVGFCMAVSRHAIDRVGPFDEELFGRGYGEENDFSMKAAGAGLRNVLCDDVYVVHLGGRSFGPAGFKPDENSMARLLSRHAGYRELVSGFIAADPLAPRREEILAALRLARVSLG